MVRKATAETISFLTFDEPVGDRPAIIAAVKDAESKNLYEYGMLTQRFFMIIQDGMINSSINRQSFTATKENISMILGKMDRVMPSVVYEIAKFNEQGMKKEG